MPFHNKATTLRALYLVFKIMATIFMRYIFKEVKDNFTILDNSLRECFSLEKSNFPLSESIKLKNCNGNLLVKLKRKSEFYYSIIRANEVYGHIDKLKEKLVLRYSGGEIVVRGDFSNNDCLFIQNNDFIIGKCFNELGNIIVETENFKELSLLFSLIYIINLSKF